MIVEVDEWDITFGDIQWRPLDENLVGLVERHKVHGKLELQISTTTHPARIRRLLPRTAQEGVLEVRFSDPPNYCTY